MSKNPRLTLGPTQPSCQSSPDASSIARDTRSVSRSAGTVPLMNSSLTVFLVNGPGLRPVNASTVAVCRPLGALNVSIGYFFETSVMMADHSGADESSDRLPRFGSLLLLPIQTPTARAGCLGSLGGARKP